MYTFEFTSEYVKKPVRNSDEDRQVLRERKTAIIEVSPAMEQVHQLLLKHAEEHVRCVAENPYI